MLKMKLLLRGGNPDWQLGWNLHRKISKLSSGSDDQGRVEVNDADDQGVFERPQRDGRVIHQIDEEDQEIDAPSA